MSELPIKKIKEVETTVQETIETVQETTEEVLKVVEKIKFKNGCFSFLKKKKNKLNV